MPPVSMKQTAIRLSPAWLQSPQGLARAQAFGDALDSMVEQAKQGVFSKLPTMAPSDGLDAIGQDRQMPRGNVGGTRELDAPYSSRLQQAWTLWQKAGTAWGLLLALYEAGYPNVALLSEKGHVYQLDVSQNLTDATYAGAWQGWEQGFPGTFWSVFSVLFFQPYPTAWGGTPPAASSGEANNIRALIARWKPAFATCSRIILRGSLAGRTWGWPSTNLWGTGAWGGLAGAVIYWDPILPQVQTPYPNHSIP